MKPDQERIHTVLTDTISLLCRNGLNYEKELRVQGVIGVTIDDSEVFIVHINETFDTSNETADAALSSASVVDCERTTPPQSRLTSRLNQRCVVTDYPDLGSSLQKSNRLGRLKSRHPVKIPGYSQSPASCLPLRAGVVSPSLAGCSISENPVLPGTFPEKKHDEYGNVEKEPNDDSQECNSRMWVNEEHSKSDTVRDVVGSCHDVDSESVAVKEDNEEGMSSNNYNSVTSSVEDSNDAVHSDADLDDRYPGIDERRIKVESEVNSTDADKACNEFSALNSTSNTAYFPESRDLSFSMDVKTEGLEHHHPSANLLASDGYDAGGLPVRSRHLAHSLSPCQTLTKQRKSFTSQPYDIAAVRKTSIPQGFASVSPRQSETRPDLWRMVSRFICDVPGCNTSFSNKQNLLRHQTHKHGRQKIPRQSRAASSFYAGNCSANILLQNFMDSSEG